jgi:hypothetical protein
MSFYRAFSHYTLYPSVALPATYRYFWDLEQWYLEADAFNFLQKTFHQRYRYVYKKQKEETSNTMSGLVEGNVLRVGERPKSECNIFKRQLKLKHTPTFRLQKFVVLLHLHMIYKWSPRS